METENRGDLLTKQALEETSALSLNQKIVSLPTFLCKICGKFLSRPIMLVVDIGNVCGGCTSGGIHNQALEAILDILLVPCPYIDNGCVELLPDTEISKHISMCRYRNYTCPLKLFEGCTWEGSLNDLLQHGTLHNNFVLPNNSDTDNAIELTLSISEDNEIINLVNIAENIFILLVKCDVQNLKQHYGVYYMGIPNNAKQFSYSIVLTGCSGFDFIKLGSGRTLTDVDFTNELHQDATEVDLSMIKQFIKDQNVSVQITIEPKCETDKVQTEILASFECPVCNLFMRPPIFQCFSGHSLCNRCQPRLAQCPTCRSAFGSTRNYTLESISVNLQFPCMNRDDGCRALLKHSDVDKHEAQCFRKQYSCPFNESPRCAWLGPLDSIVDHLKMQHNDKVVFSKYHRVTVPYSYDTNYFSLYCMVINGEVFRICYKRDISNQNSYWAVQFIGPTDLAQNYTNEIGLIDGRMEHRKLVRFELVQNLTSIDRMFNECVMLPYSVLAWFGADGELTYYCKIVKIQ